MHQNKAKLFRSFHTSVPPLILINAWNAASAQLIEQSGAVAIGTSSASLAWANGYADGGKLPAEELLHSVAQICRACTVPITVDIEDGYSEQETNVVSLVEELIDLGVVGINIEDGTESPERLISKINAIRNAIPPESLFINARTDVYLQSSVHAEPQLSETLRRINQYAEAGADCAFVPGFSHVPDLQQLVKYSKLPINLMIAPESILIETYQSRGVKRLSLGPSSFLKAYSSLLDLCDEFHPREGRVNVSYDLLNDLFA